MATTRYPISREFFPYNRFTPSVGERFVRFAQKRMKTPRFVFKDPDVSAHTVRIPSYDGEEIEVLVLKPKNAETPMPCLMDIHGGGFVFEASGSHYRHALSYAKGAGCLVVFVRYRLAPAHPFPVPQEDCYAAFRWLADHAQEIGADPKRIGIGGDSAGGTLTVTTCMMARDRGSSVRPSFQMLIYPWLDDRNTSESCRRFTDTPMWNSSLSKKVAPVINPDPSATPIAYRSPVEADSFEGLPPAYIEVAEFDPLHDDGVCYHRILTGAGIGSEFHETRGTMHGFDSKANAPTTRQMLSKRLAFLKRQFQK